MKILAFIIPFVFVLSSNAFDKCFTIAGEKYKIQPEILLSIAIVESSLNPGSVNVNKNKTKDIGLMQINSIWLPKLREYNINEKKLQEPCQNIIIGAWILSQCINKFGYTWKAIDCYNKGPSKAKNYSKYTLKVYKEIQRLKKLNKKKN